MQTIKALDKKVILVTGASRGIGKAVAKGYAKAGATVILLARNTNELSKVYDEIEALGSTTHAIYPFDLSSAVPADYEALRISLEENFNRLDGLLLNAAELGTLTPLEYYSVEQWYHILQVNLSSNFLLVQSLLPLIKKSIAASIIFTSADSKPKAYWGAYTVSKYGVGALMNILAEELEIYPHIQVNSVSPTNIKTQLRRRAYPAEDMDNLLIPEEILSTYLYLMSTESRGVTGKNFDIKFNKLS